jgi:ankyrin repeat protein
MVRRLLSAGAAVNSTVENGTTALVAAAKWGAAGIATELLQAGAAVHTADDDGVTALMWAACAGAPEVMQVLLQAGAATDAVDTSGDTVLHQAVTLGQAYAYMPPAVHELVVATLLEAGASVSANRQ